MTTRFVSVALNRCRRIFLFHQLCLCGAAMKYSAEQQHHILTQYCAHSRSDSYRALSRRYGLSSNGVTINRWMKRWDGTVASLTQRQRPGRPRLLTPRQVHNYIRQPITAANRRRTCINYSVVHQQLSRHVTVHVSRRTVRRYGKEQCGVKQKRTQARSPHERSHLHTTGCSSYCTVQH